MAFCYMDRTYCVSPNCKDKCGRKLTDEVKEQAKKWWLEVTKGKDDGAPIAMSLFCDENGDVI